MTAPQQPILADPCAGCANRNQDGVYAMTCLGCRRYTGGKWHKDRYEPKVDGGDIAVEAAIVAANYTEGFVQEREALRNIRKHGYPPHHCDADGDFKKKNE